MKRIRKWLRQYLGITTLESNVQHQLDKINQLVEVGVDQHFRGGSWAVICIAGKAEYVQFAELGEREARELMEILRHMKGRGWEYTLDAPRAFKQELVKYL